MVSQVTAYLDSLISSCLSVGLHCNVVFKFKIIFGQCLARKVGVDSLSLVSLC